MLNFDELTTEQVVNVIIASLIPAAFVIVLTVTVVAWALVRLFRGYPPAERSIPECTDDDNLTGECLKSTGCRTQGECARTLQAFSDRHTTPSVGHAFPEEMASMKEEAEFQAALQARLQETMQPVEQESKALLVRVASADGVLMAFFSDGSACLLPKEVTRIEDYVVNEDRPNGLGEGSWRVFASDNHCVGLWKGSTRKEVEGRLQHLVNHHQRATNKDVV